MNLRHLRSTAVIGLLAVAATACGSGASSGSVDLGTRPTTTTTAAPPTTATTTPATTVKPATTTTTQPEPTEDLSGFGTNPVRIDHNLAVPPLPSVVGIRAARHNGFDRVVFDLQPTLPGAESVRFVDKVVQDGSGQTLTVAGTAYLLVRFEEAQAHTETGALLIPQRIRPDLPGITEIALAGDYEGYVTVALGLNLRSSFRVFELTNPARLVVDVRTA